MKTITVLALTLSLLTLPVKAEYEPLIAMSNPFVSVENIEAAQAGAGFKFQLPFLLQCFAQPQISYIKNSLIQVLYGDPQEKHLLVRKGHGTDDNSGDYTDYPIVKKISVNKMTVTLKGSSEGYFNASWNTGAFAYAILSTEALPEDELVKLIQMLQ